MTNRHGRHASTLEAAAILIAAGLLLVSFESTGFAGGPPPESVDRLDVFVPPMDGETLEGTVVEEDDVTIDELGNTRLDLMPSAKASEPLPVDLEERLDSLSAEREAMAEAVAAQAPLQVPPLNDRAVPARMDARVRDPDRLRVAEETAEMEPAPPSYEPDTPSNNPPGESLPLAP